jgi:hypothetical protein
VGIAKGEKITRLKIALLSLGVLISSAGCGQSSDSGDREPDTSSGVIRNEAIPDSIYDNLDFQRGQLRNKALKPLYSKG